MNFIRFIQFEIRCSLEKSNRFLRCQKPRSEDKVANGNPLARRFAKKYIPATKFENPIIIAETTMPTRNYRS